MMTAHMEAHVQGEEEIFDPQLLKAGVRSGTKESTEEETEDAIKDHNEIRDGIAAVAKEQVGSEAWFKAVASTNKANSEHMGEEEREGLTDFRRQASLQLRHDLAVAFAAFEASHRTGTKTIDKDPKTYVEQNE